MTYDRANGYVYVLNSGSCAVSVIDGTNFVAAVNAVKDCSPLPYLYSAVYDSRNGFVYVVDASIGTVSVINGTELQGTVNVGGDPQYEAYDSGNGYVYVTSFISKNVTIINGTKVVGSVNLSGGPWWATYDSGNGYVYVTSYDSDNVTVLNGTIVVGSVKAGALEICAAYDSENGYVYVVNSDGYASTNPATVTVIYGTKVVGTVSVGNEPSAAAYDSGDGDIVVANYGSDNASVINGTTLVGSPSVGKGPVALAYDSENGYVYVVNQDSSNVSRIPPWFLVTFAESGLPLGTAWWTNVTTGPSLLSNTTALIFGEPNGTYLFAISTADKTYSAPGGSLVVNGTGVSVAITFSRVTYAVTFAETGLPSGASWFVNLSGSFRASTGNVTAFAEPNGTYSFRVGPVLWYFATRSSGSLVVSGSAQEVAVTFHLRLFPVSFVRVGADEQSALNWTVILGGVANSSNGSSIGFEEPNGSGYDFSVAWTGDVGMSPSVGTLNVTGAPVTETIVSYFTTGPPPPFPPSYPVTFTETGLPQGTVWWIGITGGSPTFSNTSTLTFDEPNGSYLYSVSTSDNTYASQGGSFAVNGTWAQELVAFSPVTYDLSFTEEGLPAGTVWSLMLGNASGSGPGAITFHGVANGTYRFSVDSVSGFSASPETGYVVVSGQPASQEIVFAAAPSSGPTTLSLPVLEEYAVLGGIIAALVVAAAVAILWTRGRKGSEAPMETPANPPAAP
jgi:DNA-binding beta-propeller fold protein YncE